MTKDDALDEVVEFFGAHPGFAGAAIPIPGPVKLVADGLVGKKLTLREAVEKIRAVTNGTVEVVHAHRYVSLRLGDLTTGPTHMFRVIRYY